MQQKKERYIRTTLHRYVYTELIMQMAGLPPLGREELAAFLAEHPETTMLHGRKVLPGADAVEISLNSSDATVSSST